MAISAVLPTLQPPAPPVVLYSTVSNPTTGAWTITRSTGGAALVATTTNPVVDASVALRAITGPAIDLSTLVTLLSPSGNPAYNGQLNDMPIA